VPKRDLIARVQVLLQQGKLVIAKGMPQGEVLMRELEQMRVKMTPSGRAIRGVAGRGARRSGAGVGDGMLGRGEGVSRGIDRGRGVLDAAGG